jgi:hypothetical protein
MIDDSKPLDNSPNRDKEMVAAEELQASEAVPAAATPTEVVETALTRRLKEI